jgi:hypothetical protein
MGIRAHVKSRIGNEGTKFNPRKTFVMARAIPAQRDLRWNNRRRSRRRATLHRNAGICVWEQTKNARPQHCPH